MSERQDVERCPAPADVLLAYEGELPPTLGRRVLAHVWRCDVCRERVRADETISLDVLDYLIRRYDPDRARPSRREADAFDRVLREPRHTRLVRLRRTWASRQMMAAAAVILIVAGGLALPPAHAESLRGMLARVAAAVRTTFFDGSGDAASQARAIRTTERRRAAPAPPAPATPPDAEDTIPQSAGLPDRDTLDQAELDARLVLSDASLDLLRGIHVSSTQKNVRVEGVIPSPRRRVVARLNALPYVRVALRPGQAGDGGEPRAAPVSGLSRWVDYRLGDRPEKQTFVPELTRLATAVTERVHMLHVLAERYSYEAVKRLSPAARGKLQKLLDRHYQSLSNDLDALDARFAVLFGSTTRVLPSRRAPGDWQERVNVGLTHAESLDRSLRQLLTLDDLPPVPPEDDAPAGDRAVTIAFGALWDAVHAARP